MNPNARDAAPSRENRRLRRKAKQPLYIQLAEILRAEAERLPPGMRFDGDRALCLRFGVSQPVVRAALNLLVQGGSLHRIRGSGTFSGPAPSTKTARTVRVTVVAPLSEHVAHARILSGIAQILERSAVELNYREIGLEGVIGDDGRMIAYPLAFARRQIATAADIIPELLDENRGVIWISPFSVCVPQADAKLIEHARRTVFVNARFLQGGISHVVADYLGGAFEMCAHLAADGRRRIGYLGGPKGFLFSEQRREGYHKAIEAFGLCSDTRHIYAEMSFQTAEQIHAEAYQAVRRMISGPNRPDAIFCAMDALAIEAIHAIDDAGLHCPRDIAIGGFDDSPAAAQQRPPLSTIRQPYHELGRTAARMLLNQLDQDAPPGACTLIPCTLVPRASTTNETRMDLLPKPDLVPCAQPADGVQE